MCRSDWLPRASWTLAAIVWLAAGPLTLPLVGAIRCRHNHAMVSDHAGHMRQVPASNPQSPCYCDQMTGGLDAALLLTPAVPAVFPSMPQPMLAPVPGPIARFPRLASRVAAPTPPPPIALA